MYNVCLLLYIITVIYNKTRVPVVTVELIIINCCFGDCAYTHPEIYFDVHNIVVVINVRFPRFVETYILMII